MLPEAGATELIFLAAVALIVVGPKDLPILMRKVGQALAKMRGLAAEFRASFDELARQSELDELRKEVEALRHQRFDPITPQVQSHFQEINASLNDYSSSSPSSASAADPEHLADMAEHGVHYGEPDHGFAPIDPSSDSTAQPLAETSAAEGGEPEAAPSAAEPVMPPPANEPGEPRPPAAEARG